MNNYYAMQITEQPIRDIVKEEVLKMDKSNYQHRQNNSYLQQFIGNDQYVNIICEGNVNIFDVKIKEFDHCAGILYCENDNKRKFVVQASKICYVSYK